MAVLFDYRKQVPTLLTLCLWLIQLAGITMYRTILLAEYVRIDSSWEAKTIKELSVSVVDFAWWDAMKNL